MTTDYCSLKGVNDLKFYSQMKGINWEFQTILRNNFLYIVMVSHESIVRDNGPM